MNANTLIEQVLGIPVQQSPVYTAKALLKQCYKGQEQKIRDTSFDLRDLPFYESARPIVFRRPLEASMIGKTVHHYDKRSAYLSACSSTNTGIGDPVHVWDGDDNTHVVPGLPGIYRVSINRLPLGYLPYDGSFVPILDADQEWITNDVLIYAQSKGYDFTIIEAWVFPDYDRILGNRDEKRNWAKRIWDARQALKRTMLEPTAHDMQIIVEAYSMMKDIAIVGLGSFATSKEKYSGRSLIHPNWFFDVVGKARVNMLANLETFAAVNTPVLVETDGLWFVSRDENYRTAIPGILDRMDKLGGYEHRYSFKLTVDIVSQADGLSEGDLATLFHKGGKVS